KLFLLVLLKVFKNVLSLKRGLFDHLLKCRVRGAGCRVVGVVNTKVPGTSYMDPDARVMFVRAVSSKDNQPARFRIKVPGTRYRFVSHAPAVCRISSYILGKYLVPGTGTRECGT